MKYTYILIAIFLVVLTSCNSNKVPKDAKTVEPIAQAQTPEGSFVLANISLAIPDSWVEEKASNSMRVTQFSLKENPEYEVVVSYFGNNDKMVKANIERWRTQFSEEESYAKLETTVKGVTGVKILGTYKLKAFPMADDYTDTPNYGTLAAIVPSAEGPYFLKLTAPKEVIETQTEAFTQVLNSYRSK